MEDLVTYIVRGLVDHPDDVQVSKVEGDSTVILELSVNASDVDLVRGDGNETLAHLKAVLSAASGRRKAVLELVDAVHSADSEEE
jgi:predicted RNA-binding protein YlqC (UPF0109 family)